MIQNSITDVQSIYIYFNLANCSFQLYAFHFLYSCLSEGFPAKVRWLSKILENCKKEVWFLKFEKICFCEFLNYFYFEIICYVWGGTCIIVWAASSMTQNYIRNFQKPTIIIFYLKKLQLKYIAYCLKALRNIPVSCRMRRERR